MKFLLDAQLPRRLVYRLLGNNVSFPGQKDPNARASEVSAVCRLRSAVPFC